MKVFMRNIPLKNFAILTALAIGVSVAGCAGGARVKRDTSYIARDVDTLYATAKAKLGTPRSVDECI
jgi:outer membrane protein assembly factor BamD